MQNLSKRSLHLMRFIVIKNQIPGTHSRFHENRSPPNLFHKKKIQLHDEPSCKYLHPKINTQTPTLMICVFVIICNESIINFCYKQKQLKKIAFNSISK